MNQENIRKKILIIEDEPAIMELLFFAFRREGFNTTGETTGVGGLNRIHTEKPDLLLLDLMLPDMNGLDICKKVKSEENIPVIILTAKSDIVDKVCGFNFGADDYIVKPFDIREVVVRVKAAFRRIDELSEIRKTSGQKVLNENISINAKSRKVTNNGISVDLTPKEFELLHVLSDNIGIVFTRDKLLDMVWGYDCVVDTRTVDIHILRLRKKLGDANALLIQTVFGVGYKIDPGN